MHPADIEHPGHRERFLRQIIQAVHSSLDLDIVFQEIANSLGRLLGADRCFISRYDAHAGVLSPPTREYRSSEAVESMLSRNEAFWALFHKMAGIICHQEELLSFDAEQANALLPAGQDADQLDIASGLGCSVNKDGQCMAILFLHQVHTRRTWTDTEKDLIRLVALQTATAIHHAELHQESIKRCHQQHLIAEIYKTALTGASLDELFDLALHKVREGLDVTFAKIIEHDDGQTEPKAPLILRAALGFPSEQVGGRFDAGEEPHSAYTLSSLSPVVVKDIHTETRFQPSPLHFKLGLISGVSAVIYGEQRPFGVLEADSQQKRRFDSCDIDFMQGVANILGIAIERKRFEEQSRESQQRFSLLVDSVQDYAIYWTDPQGHLVSWNQGAERIYQYTEDEILGRHFSVFFPDEQTRQQECEHLLQQALDSGRVYVQGKRKRKNGDVFNADVVITAVRNPSGALVGFANIIRDTTDIQQAEAWKLALLDTSVDAIITIDANSRVLEWSPAAERIFGYSRTQALGQNMAELIIPERFRAAHFNGIHHYLATGEGPLMNRLVEIPALKADGSEFMAELAITRIPVEGPPRFTGTVRDITDRKRTESELLAYQEQLEQSNRDLQHFAAVVSHDLKAPLRKIRFFSDHIFEMAHDQLDPDNLGDLQRIRHSAEQMQTLIDDLLALAKLSNQDRPMENVDLSQVVATVMDNLHQSLQENQAQVHIGPLVTVRGDRVLLQQLLQNLVENAVKFHKPGQAPQITIRSHCREDACEIIVEDQGIGFPPEKADRLFHPFERLHSKHTYPGTGVGLAICKRIAERHGGVISATGRPGEGACFTVVLPWARPPDRLNTAWPDNPDQRVEKFS